MRDSGILVSIIIPVYNVEKYLNKSIQSAVEQTYKKIEIILVNDGSKDSSGEICDRWQRHDQRIKVIHKENGGLSSARNAALDLCKGDFVYFLDSDDYIEENTIEIMLQDAYDTGAQIVEAPFVHIYDNKIICRSNLKKMIIMSTVDAIRYDLSGEGGAVSSCSKLFDARIFSEYRFAEGKLNEDHFAIVDLLSKAQIIAIEPKALYYYTHRKSSITTEKFSINSLDDIEAAQKNHETICRLYPQAIDVAEFRIDLSTLRVIDKIMLSDTFENEELLDKLINKVKKNRNRILKSRYFTLRRKFAFFILLTTRTLYRWFVRENARRSWGA